MNRHDHYKILGVDSDATLEEIKRAYRRKAKMYHPDINKANDSQEKMKAINVAYDVLSDPVARERYDYLRSNPNANHQYYNQTQYYYDVNSDMMQEIFKQFNQQQYKRQASQRNRTSLFITLFKWFIYYQLIQIFFTLIKTLKMGT